MKALISGFEPFDGDAINPSKELVTQVLPQKVGDWELEGVILPVSFERAFPTLKEAIELHQPDLVLAMGVAKNRIQVSFERIGINWMEARIPDNEGFQPKGQKIIKDGPDGIFTSLSLTNIMDISREKKLSVEISNSAGTYVCNRLMYELQMHSQKRSISSGFVHLPPCPEMRGESLKSMSVPEVWETLKSVLFFS
ncbi:MAG: pyroglutamyl-peptidase I [Bdellovibrionaceae bacterium]|nr:pyroglutamyl-peptidase I [Pseudobdellovibrionaceae bacterium]|tara:strand:- start:447 stop:1034 length:588 start_codon:yes stop_codon:yes gene_type:complete